MRTTRQKIVAVALGISMLACVARGAEEYSMIEGIGRGCANLFTGWLEIPRCMTFYTVEWPGIGLFPGTIEGTGLTLYRMVGGMVDLVTVGYLKPGNTLYDAMDEPMYPWQGPWLPSDDETMP